MVRRVLERRLEPTGRDVAIVGAGPTGLTCAFYLSLQGHSVTVYDSRPAPGGMLRYALPEYRLPKNVLDREIELIERLGVTFRCDVNIGEDVTLNDIAHQYDAVFLSIGTWKEAWIYIPGTELTGVLPALPFLEAVGRGEKVSVGRRVVVVGGGNGAIDSARTARRLGADVTIVYRRERGDMPAIPEEVEGAEHEGVRISFLAAPHRIVGDRGGQVRAMEVVRTKLGEFDTSGRRRPMPTDEVIRLECDTVILAIGQKVDPDFLKASGLKVKEAGTIEVDRYSLESSRDRFYAGGDLITGSSNVSNAMGYGKNAARSIDQRLMGRDRFAEPFPVFGYVMVPPELPSESRRHVPAERPAAKRVLSYAEVSLGLTPLAAMEEAHRCLRCDARGGER
jgi:NADPH-dependent glutamate synthase beta subunit-like oxidoreductase